MNEMVRNKLVSNSLYIKYLKEHSYWYKFLNRNSEYLTLFLKEVKDNYKLNPEDKIRSISKKVANLNKILDILS